LLAFSTQVRGFKPGRSRRIFRAEKKILSTPSFGGEVKPSVPRKFTACKRTQKWRGSRHFRQFLAHSFTFRYWCSLASLDAGDPLWRELKRSKSLVLQVGGLTCRWQRHSVKTFLLRIFDDSWAGQNPQGLQSQLKKKKKNHFYWPTNALNCIKPKG